MDHLLNKIYFCYIPLFNTRTSYLLIGTWSDHPGKTYYHKTWRCLSQLIRNFSVWYALPERGWGLTGNGV
jgi:hypothetical protein